MARKGRNRLFAEAMLQLHVDGPVRGQHWDGRPDVRDDRQRLDKWLWFARFARTRPAAVRLVEDGHVRVEGRRVGNPAHGLKRGDVLTLALPHATVVVRVVSLGVRRESYEQARLLYERLDEGGRGDASLAEDDGDG